MIASRHCRGRPGAEDAPGRLTGAASPIRWWRARSPGWRSTARSSRWTRPRRGCRVRRASARRLRQPVPRDRRRLMGSAPCSALFFSTFEAAHGRRARARGGGAAPAAASALAGGGEARLPRCGFGVNALAAVAGSSSRRRCACPSRRSSSGCRPASRPAGCGPAGRSAGRHSRIQFPLYPQRALGVTRRADRAVAPRCAARCARRRRRCSRRRSTSRRRASCCDRPTAQRSTLGALCEIRAASAASSPACCRARGWAQAASSSSACTSRRSAPSPSGGWTATVAYRRSPTRRRRCRRRRRRRRKQAADAAAEFDDEKKVPFVVPMLSGGVAGVMIDVTLFVDTLKVRAIAGPPPLPQPPHLLWRGIGAAAAPAVPAAAFFVVYEEVKQRLDEGLALRRALVRRGLAKASCMSASPRSLKMRCRRRTSARSAPRSLPLVARRRSRAVPLGADARARPAV